ncbi:MAG TPA: NAD-dependent epimerase/dehydratase family protein, partial [Pyrinomonadaceae bacterium]|nr:NAD-dependent epimerase/dehydratase family protein [Pyrinomonadaceae bacterium]
MSTSRRQFLKLSALVGGSVGLGLVPGVSALSNSPGSSGRAPKSLRILILGGTGFTGPFQVKYALSRGHKVTVFNRGKTHPGDLPKEAEQLIGDRNGQLDALKNRKWDVCIDIPTTLPVWVRDAAQILKGNIDRYVFISTISVFSDVSKVNTDENGPLAEYKGADAMKETPETLRASNYGLYGPLKVQSEKETE